MPQHLDEHRKAVDSQGSSSSLGGGLGFASWLNILERWLPVEAASNVLPTGPRPWVPVTAITFSVLLPAVHSE